MAAHNFNVNVSGLLYSDKFQFEADIQWKNNKMDSFDILEIIL